MTGQVRMFGPPGCDEANHGEQKFRIRDDGSFWVCPAAVEPLCKVGGFVIAPNQLPASLPEIRQTESALETVARQDKADGTNVCSIAENETGITDANFTEVHPDHVGRPVQQPPTLGRLILPT